MFSFLFLLAFCSSTHIIFGLNDFETPDHETDRIYFKNNTVGTEKLTEINHDNFEEKYQRISFATTPQDFLKTTPSAKPSKPKKNKSKNRKNQKKATPKKKTSTTTTLKNDPDEVQNLGNNYFILEEKLQEIQVATTTSKKNVEKTEMVKELVPTTKTDFTAEDIFNTPEVVALIFLDKTTILETNTKSTTEIAPEAVPDVPDFFEETNTSTSSQQSTETETNPKNTETAPEAVPEVPDFFEETKTSTSSQPLTEFFETKNETISHTSIEPSNQTTSNFVHFVTDETITSEPPSEATNTTQNNPETTSTTKTDETSSSFNDQPKTKKSMLSSYYLYALICALALVILSITISIPVYFIRRHKKAKKKDSLTSRDKRNNNYPKWLFDEPEVGPEDEALMDDRKTAITTTTFRA